uniref:uncharacterized protein C16orf46 homolog isoform X2 n=1 Tax=Pristiophorus japonicus TaxID=55135 RepID=UPI00398E5BDE
MNEQINNLNLLDENLSWKMDFQEEEAFDSEKITFSNTPRGDDVVISPTHFLHSWESERKLIDVLISLSEDTYEDQRQMDQFIVCSGWDDAVHSWRSGNPYSSNHTLKKPKKVSKEERNASHCVLCTEMLPVSEKKAIREADQSHPSSKSSNSRAVHHFTREVAQEVHTQEKAETEVNLSHETECEMTHSPDQQAPVKKHFSVLPPVKMANGDEKFASGFKPGRMFYLGTQNGNQVLKRVSEVSESNNGIATMCIRAHACNMAMLQVSRMQKTVTSDPVGITRIPLLHTTNHWCWKYSFMQGSHNMAVVGAPASKLMECHSVGQQPLRIKHPTKNLKQDNFSKYAFSHSGPGDKYSNRARPKNVTGRDVLPVIPQPGPPPASGARIAISILPHMPL